MTDFSMQRSNMVESQVRPSDVTDRRLMRAMLDLPRELFLPAWGRSVAYADEDVPVSRPESGRPSRKLLAPRILAKLIQAAEIQDRDRVLDLGCATGYSTAVLARLASEVIGLEEELALASAARVALEAVACRNARIEHGPLSQGWAASAPYDVIIMNGSVGRTPEVLLGQLARSGRLVSVVAGPDGFGSARVHTRKGETFSERIVFDAGAARLPGFESEPGFVL